MWLAGEQRVSMAQTLSFGMVIVVVEASNTQHRKFCKRIAELVSLVSHDESLNNHANSTRAYTARVW
jgi:hypothetical protein